MVGPEHLKKLPPEVVDPLDLMTVKGNRAYEQIDEICEWVRERVDKDELFLFSIGMAAAVVVHRLQGEFPGIATFYDAGAVWDPYCGVYSRKTYAKEEWRENIMPRNLL